MMSACARAVRVSALLVLPASAFAQSSRTRTPTIFSQTSQVGMVSVRAAVVLADYSVKPLPLLKVVARRTDRADSVSAETDLDGRLMMTLRVGTYTLRANPAQPIEGKQYAWNVRVIVRPARTERVQLTNTNASQDGVPVKTTVAAAPTPPAPTPPAPTAPAAAPKKVAVAPVDSARPVAPVPARTAAPSPPPAAPAAPAAPVSTASSTTAVATQPSPFAPPVSSPAMTPAPARVQHHRRRVNTSNLLLGLSFDASSIRSDDLNASTESGAGLAAQLGWGFTKNFALVIDASAARIGSLSGDFDLAHVDVGGRWHFVGARSAFVPFVEVGYSGRAAMKKDALMTDTGGNLYTGDVSILGSGVSLGGGFHYFVTPKVAIGGALKWTTGQFSRVQIDNVSVDGFAIDATSARFNMGFSWFPMAR